MIRVNPNPHAHGYQYAPTKAVTAFFPPDRDPSAALQALAEAGFEQDRIDLFTGPEGADRLDPEGKRHGPWVRFRRFVEGKFDESHELLHKAEETMRSGGTVVEVFTNGEMEKRHRAAEVLKASGGMDVMYWGRLMTEFM